MALSDTRKAQLAEILGIPHPDLVASELLAITEEQETILEADIDRYQVIKRSYGKFSGAGDGLIFDFADERGDIKRRCIRMLDCQYVIDAYSAGSNTIERA